MRRRWITAVLGFVGASFAVLPGGAGAAQIVGSDLAATPDSAPAPNTTSLQSVQTTGNPLPVIPTVSGVIVSIRLKHGVSGADPGMYGFRILSGVLPNLTARIPVEQPDVVWPANDTPGTRTFTPTMSGVPGGIPKGIPISAGEYLGFVRIGGTMGDGLDVRFATPGGERRFVLMAHNSGPADYSGTTSNSEQLIQYTVEADADRDGFGDESQDNCIGTFGTVRGCPNTLTLGKVKGTKKKVTVKATIPGAGALTGGSATDKTLAAAAKKKKKAGPPLKQASQTVSSKIQQTVALTLPLSKAGRAKLAQKGKLGLSIKVLYTPVGGTAGSATVRAKLRPKKRKKK